MRNNDDIIFETEQTTWDFEGWIEDGLTKAEGIIEEDKSDKERTPH